ncbi:MAG: hypothetical protein QME94_14755, partial [Anaerolineae bacterium]|nr:hypothetical protein [Anaerolineae bacterium]
MSVRDIVRLVLPRGQTWPGDLSDGLHFGTPSRSGVPYCEFRIGGYDALGHGERVLTISTPGVCIQDGIDLALERARAAGLGPVAVCRTTAEFTGATA